MSRFNVSLSPPPPLLFKFPPDPSPPTLPPPSDERTLASPFPINPKFYNNALDWRIPIIFATSYFVVVTVMNWWNRKRGNKPFWISTTRPFYAFVILHNILLAVYSSLSCYAMIWALKRSLPHWTEPDLVVRVTDALCKMHGPRNLGDATSYNPETEQWEFKNPIMKLTEFGTPDPTDVGRMWNEGLAFWGWFFYLSKFYEVLDTAIILAKGKRSSTLQKYHHAGAMVCMWAGIRYMSPPIWMFVLVNSGIHALMYTYYTLSALGVRIPRKLKQTLTTMQIAQFVVGASYAAAHLFVNYTIPVSLPYTFMKTVSNVFSTVSTAFPSATNSATASVVTAGVGNMLKKFVYRAAQMEGLAGNVEQDHTLQIFEQVAEPIEHIINEVKHHITKEVRYEDSTETVFCITTSGQSFAIWLNVVYLLPLTGLFIRFFIRSYSKRTASTTKHPTQTNEFGKSINDAAKGVSHKLDSLDKKFEDKVSEVGVQFSQTVSKTVQQTFEGMKGTGAVVPEKMKEIEKEVKEAGENFTKKLKSELRDLNGENGHEAKESAKKKYEETKKMLKDGFNDGVSSFQEKLERALSPERNGQRKTIMEETKDKAENASEKIKGEIKSSAETVKSGSKTLTEESRETERSETTQDIENDPRAFADVVNNRSNEEAEESKKEEEEWKQEYEGASSPDVERSWAEVVKESSSEDTESKEETTESMEQATMESRGETASDINNDSRSWAEVVTEGVDGDASEPKKMDMTTEQADKDDS